MTNETAEELARLVEQGRVLHQQGRFEAAASVYKGVLQRHPAHLETLNLMGVLSAQSRRFDQALQYFERGIAASPTDSSLHCNRGLALKELNRLTDALSSFSRAIELNAQDAIPHYYRGNVLNELGRINEAFAAYSDSIKINPQFAFAYFNRGTLLHSTHKLEAALDDYDRAIANKPDYADAFGNRGHVLQQLNRIEEASASYQRAIDIRPDAIAYVHLGNAMRALNRLNEALECHGRATELNPAFAQAYANRGVVFYELGNIDEALRSYDKALTVDPGYVEAYFNRGALLRSVQRFEPAIADFEAAHRLQPDIKYLAGALLEAKLQICDWSGLDATVKHINDGVERGDPVSHPFAYLTFSDDGRLQRKAAEIFAQDTYPADTSLGPISARTRAEKIRIAYFSMDFREHPVSRLLAGLIDNHDRSKFEILGFSFGPDSQDAMRRRLELSFDRFVDVRQKSDRDVALLARSLNVDIAVDLGGYTTGGRTRIFAMRAAPLQVSYLGYLGTLGASYMDYMVADATIIPPEHQQFYAEKIIYLPSYQANDSQRRMSRRTFGRTELGLPTTGFVFCCVNTAYKITPAAFDSWMRILQRVPHSSLFLSVNQQVAREHLSARARECGVEANRIVFGTQIPVEDYLARYRVMDLFLDTLPYNAGTTASDALWSGLPVLTRMGSSFTGRMAASLLRAIDLPELIATSAAQYEELAVQLALNPDKLADIKSRLESNRSTQLLFDHALFARNLEAAYGLAHERYLTGLPADHIVVG